MDTLGKLGQYSADTHPKADKHAEGGGGSVWGWCRWMTSCRPRGSWSALCVCLICLPSVSALYMGLVSLDDLVSPARELVYMSALYVCLLCLPYISALYVVSLEDLVSPARELVYAYIYRYVHVILSCRPRGSWCMHTYTDIYM